MKIALVSDDGKTISRHFGRATYYVVLTIENGQVVQRELRNKLGHGQFAADGHQERHQHGEGHGFGDAAHARHTRMVEAIQDCQVVIGGGMGMGAYDGLKRNKLTPILTNLEEIDQAVQAYLAGTLTHQEDLLH